MTAAIMLAVLAAPLGGLLNRVRGGLWGDVIRARLWAGYGTQGGRGVFALATAMFAVLTAWDWRLGGLAPLVFVGLVFGWLKSADVGRDRDRPRLVEGAIMTARGLVMTAPAGAFLWWLGYGPWLIPAGMALGLLYELGHRTPDRFGVDRGMEWAEVFTGLWLWLALGLGLTVAP